MGSGAVRLRVHIAPIRDEVLRVVEPMRMLNADVAVLITLGKTDRSGLNAEKIIKELEREHMPAQVIESNIFDTSAIVNEVGAIVSASPQHDYMFNVSTGPRAASLAGTIAGMFWRVRPYSMSVDDQGKPVHSERDFPTMGGPQFIPTFQIPLLDVAAVHALEFIAGKKDPIAKHELISHLEESGKVGPRQKKTVSKQALYGQIDAILYKLQSWGFVSFDGHGKSVRISITETGIEGRKMFFHMLSPPKPLHLLASKPY